MMAIQHHESQVYKNRSLDYFETIYQESEDNMKVMAIAMHPYLSGSPHRIKYVRETFEEIIAARIIARPLTPHVRFRERSGTSGKSKVALFGGYFRHGGVGKRLGVSTNVDVKNCLGRCLQLGIRPSALRCPGRLVFDQSRRSDENFRVPRNGQVLERKNELETHRRRGV